MKLKLTAIVAACALLVSSAAAQQQQWKDRQEYDMFQEMVKETDPTKKLEKIKAWQDKYPESAFKKEGITLRLNTYAQTQKFPEVISTANEILAIDSCDLTSLYWQVTLVRTMNATSPNPAALDAGDKQANQLLGCLDKIFAAEKKPANVDPAAWTKARTDMESLSLKTLAWIALAKKDNPGAETRIKTFLDKFPNDGESTYWLYQTIRAQKDPKRNSEALFYLARAASLPTDKGGLPEAQRKQIDDFFGKAYTSYHGKDDAGLAELRKLAIDSPKPPAGFEIKDKGTLGVEEENKLRAEQPQFYFWRNLRKQLDENPAFFESMKDAALPGKIEGTELSTFKGRLVSSKPETNPKELVLQMDPNDPPGGAGDVTLRLDKPMRGKADTGTEIQFEGIAKEFTKDPFMVTFEVEQEKVQGWPVQAAPVKKAAPARKAGGKKKR